MADAYRRTWPAATVRRALQAHRAFEPDVVLAGAGRADRLWTECNHADEPNPLAKLEQAERDVHALDPAGTDRPTHGLTRWPVVVWRRTGARAVNATTRLWVLFELDDWRGTKATQAPVLRPLVVTLGFEELLTALKALDS